jgi:signal transduction histidine kinase
LVIAVRWATIAVGLALAALEDTDRTGFLVLGVPLVAYAVLRTVRPLRYLSGDVEGLVGVLAEVGLCLAVVVATDYWNSPYAFCLASAILAAGFARGFGFAIRTATTAAAAVAIPYHLQAPDPSVGTTVQWAGELLLIALVAGYARRLFGEAEQQSAVARQANDLLTQLNAVARTLPASLDLAETVDATVRQLRDLFPIDVVAILLWEDATETWTVAAAEGARLPASLRTPEIPAAARDAVIDQRSRRTDDPRDALAGPGVATSIYVPMLARDRLVGIVAVESRDRDLLVDRERQLADGVATQAALALDNARWFQRLRTVGADEERTRIARDLHDRVGQSLAFVSFELDRISRHAAKGEPVDTELAQLRDELRGVVTEVRDTLYDLRTDVTERKDLVATLAEFVDRVQDRSMTAPRMRFDFVADQRLPIRVEREVWRIAQEAITNAIKHAGAEHVRVTWRCEAPAEPAVLEVVDDGRGMADGVPHRPDAFGLVGMRERADAIGARLDVGAGPDGRGTAVRLEIARPA